jgi:dihydrofolate reductase
MRTLVVTNLISLDGFMTGPGGNLSTLPFDFGFSEYNLERFKAADTLLLGRKTFSEFRAYWPSKADDEAQPPVERELSRRNTAMEKIVISDTLTSEDTTGWGPVRVVKRADAHHVVRELKDRDGQEILIHGSHTLWNDLLAAGLVDELHLMIGPGAMREGIRAFEAPVKGLRLVELRKFENSSLFLTRYAVKG